MTAKYAFDSNLLKLSMNKEIELAKKEWIVIRKDKTPNKDGICICQHTIKNIVYCYNINTKRYISVGLVCCKKFQLKLKKSGNKLLIKVFDEIFEKGFDEIFEKGGYSKITDIFEYSDKVECELKRMAHKMYEHITDISELHLLLAQIKNLIDEYKFEYMQTNYDIISEKIVALTPKPKSEIAKRYKEEQARLLEEGFCQRTQQFITIESKAPPLETKPKSEIVKRYEEEQARLLEEQKRGCSKCVEAKRKGYKQCYICKNKGKTDCKKCAEANERGFLLCYKCNENKKKAKGCEMCNGTGQMYWSDDVYGECIHCQDF